MQTQGWVRTRGSPRRRAAIFELAVEDGWPPVGSERAWAFHLGEDRYRIDNPPWFVPDLAVGDVVRAEASQPDSHPVFKEIVQRSDHVTIRLICFRDGPLGRPGTRVGALHLARCLRGGCVCVRHARPRRRAENPA
ncbi:DUF4265 domain-containing protein [Terrabacter sp. 2YAF2]|uniref:DUF4265 domain-containing protein n=1 Tax=Terrabacter sp. 2YAF2 TaxID=3233026 RepID=UPI003F995B96